jgi:hypothetical protein
VYLHTSFCFSADVVFYPEKIFAEKVSEFLLPVWSFAGSFRNCSGGI